MHYSNHQIVKLVAARNVIEHRIRVLGPLTEAEVVRCATIKSSDIDVAITALGARMLVEDLLELGVLRRTFDEVTCESRIGLA